MSKTAKTFSALTPELQVLCRGYIKVARMYQVAVIDKRDQDIRGRSGLVPLALLFEGALHSFGL